MKKIFRIYKNIYAQDQDEALKQADSIVLDAISDESTIANIFNVVEYPFNREEELTILEIARMALLDDELCNYVVDKLYLSDDEFKNLRQKIKSYCSP